MGFCSYSLEDVHEFCSRVISWTKYSSLVCAFSLFYIGEIFKWKGEVCVSF